MATIVKIKKKKVIKDKPSKVSIDSIRDPECSACELGDDAQCVCMMGKGPTPCDIMIVGEAPGQREDETGIPFQGKAGQLLDEILKKAGLNRDKIYITNTVKCHPPENRSPSKDEIGSCKEYLMKEIAMVKPKYVMLMGAVAFQSIFNKKGVMEHRGKVMEKDGVQYFITLHPAAALRMPKFRPSLEADINRLGRLLRGDIDDCTKIKWTLVDNSNKLKLCIQDLKDADMISYDIECSGKESNDYLNPKSYIYCLGLGTENHNWVIPLTYPGSPFLKRETQHKIMNMVEQAMDGKKCIAQNGKFDNKWLWCKYGFQPKQTFDTMLAAYALDENGPIGLKPLSKIHFAAPEYELHFPLDVNGVPLSKMAEYNAYDVYYTLKLYKIFRKMLMEDKPLLRVYKYLLMPASLELEKVELEGVYVDREKYPAALAQCEEKVNNALAELDKMSGKTSCTLNAKGKPGKDGFNWNSNDQVAKYLFGELKLPILEKTKGGKPSTSGESVLPRLKDKHPIVEKLLDYRENKKLLEFLTSWGNMMDRNNKMHPSFKLHGTVTGRLSCVEPNFQQVPRDTFVRSLITAPPGWVFMEADYSQVELRVAAMVADEKNMKMAYNTGQDLHTKTAAGVSGVSQDKVTKDMRKKAKAVNFGFIYGMWWKKFKDYARDKYGVILTDDEAREYREAFFEMYPDLITWHQRQKRLAQKYKYVRNPIGWKRRLPEVDSPDKGVRQEAERQAINSPVQGFASQLCVYSMVRCSREIPKDKFRPVGLVHDAMMGIIKAEYADEIARKVKAIMEDTATVEKVFHAYLPVPIVADVKIGPWGSGREIQF